MRQQLEEQADRWGIPYTGNTSDDDLRGLIDKRQQRSPEMTDVDTKPADTPACYGLLWEGVEGAPCMDCAYVRGGCLQTFVTKRLPILREQLGPNPSLEQLSQAAGVPQNRPLRPEAILVALDLENKLLKGEVTQTKPGSVGDAWDEGDTSEPPEQDPPPVQAQTDQQQSDQSGEPAGPPAEPKTKEKSVAAKKKAPQRKKTAAPAKEPVKKKASSKKATKKAAKKKASKKVVAKKKVKNPPKAGPVQRAKVPAKKKLPAKSAPPAKAQRSGSQDNHLQPSTQAEKKGWMRRWDQERVKHPTFAKATPGSTLIRQFKGTEYRVKVYRGSYHLLSTEIWAPTLGMMTTIITGTQTHKKQAKVTGKTKTRPKGTRQLSNWSAIRFWKTAFEDR